LEVVNVPHHSIADDNKIGKAIVEVRSMDDDFKKVNEFQTLHKNTLHIGLQVERDGSGGESRSPYFFNFQYDKRTGWGVETSVVEDGYVAMMGRMGVVEGLTRYEAWTVDVALLTHAITEEKGRGINADNIGALLETIEANGIGPDLVGEIQRQSRAG